MLRTGLTLEAVHDYGVGGGGALTSKRGLVLEVGVLVLLMALYSLLEAVDALHAGRKAVVISGEGPCGGAEWRRNGGAVFLCRKGAVICRTKRLEMQVWWARSAGATGPCRFAVLQAFWAQIGVWGSQSREDKCRSTFHNRGRAKLENRICAPAKSRKSGAE
jgi:hypothetical protein